VGDELADRPFAVAEQIQDLEPPRLGEDLQRSEFPGHGQPVFLFSYMLVK
jgi:hypothetical protein